MLPNRSSGRTGTSVSWSDSLVELAKAELVRLKTSTKKSIDDLAEFAASVDSRFVPPHHLRPIFKLFERAAAGEQVQACFSLPPRHSKTEGTFAAMLKRLKDDPAVQLCYGSYAAKIAEKKSRRARDIAKAIGIPIAIDSRARRDWRTGVHDGGMWATSVDGQVTGEGFNHIVLDDLFKGRAEAESQLIRDRAYTWVKSDVLSRLEPGGSIFVSGTRWHVDDVIGRLVKEGWEYINLAALALPNDPLGRPEGEPLWPVRWSRENLLKIRDRLGGENGYDWLSQYQGIPVQPGTQIFKGVHFYDQLPHVSLMRICIGLDFGFTATSSSDASCAVVLGELNGKYYLIDVLFVRETPDLFRSRVEVLYAQFPNAILRTHCAATEEGSVYFFRETIPSIENWRAVDKKHVRAIPTANAWNTGNILMPRSSTWGDALVSELMVFDGMPGGQDNRTDALVGAYDGLVRGMSPDWEERERLMLGIPLAVQGYS